MVSLATSSINSKEYYRSILFTKKKKKKEERVHPISPCLKLGSSWGDGEIVLFPVDDSMIRFESSAFEEL